MKIITELTFHFISFMFSQQEMYYIKTQMSNNKTP